MLEIRTFELPPIGTNAFWVGNPENKQALLIDAPATAFAVAEAVSNELGYQLQALLLTHGHFDHIMDLKAFNLGGIPVYAHAADRQMIESPKIQSSLLPGIPDFEAGRVDVLLQGSEVLELIGTQFAVRHVPGHAPGNVVFYSAKQGCAFVGDAIFAGGVGRTDLPGGDWDTLEKSIREQIYTLPDATTLYPGHGPATTVQREKTSNPYVRF